MPENGPSVKLSTGERRTRVLAALVDGEWRVPAIAAWADVSQQAVRADLRWLEREGFAAHQDLASERRWWATVKGQEYILDLPAEEVNW